MAGLLLFSRTIGADTPSKLESAAVWRFDDAERLREDRPTGALYLYGYVAEACLQCASLYVIGYKAHTEVTKEALGRIIAEANQQRVMGASPHNLVGWAEFLVYKREQLGKPLKNALRDEANRYATALYGRWRPSLRYRSLLPSPDDLKIARQAAMWFRDNRVYLRS